MALYGVGPRHSLRREPALSDGTNDHQFVPKGLGLGTLLGTRATKGRYRRHERADPPIKRMTGRLPRVPHGVFCRGVCVLSGIETRPAAAAAAWRVVGHAPHSNAGGLGVNRPG